MSTAQRISLGFHRLGLVLGIIVLVVILLTASGQLDWGAVGLAIFLAALTYLLARAIGWVIGGFAS
jgi:hypothetical protein